MNSTDLHSRDARRQLHLLFLSLSRRPGPSGPVNTQERLPCARFAVRIARLAMREMLARDSPNISIHKQIRISADTVYSRVFVRENINI